MRAKRQNAPAAAGEPDRYFTIFVPLFQRKTEADFLYWTQGTGGEFPWRKKFTTSNKAFFRATAKRSARLPAAAGSRDAAAEDRKIRTSAVHGHARPTAVPPREIHPADHDVGTSRAGRDRPSLAAYRGPGRPLAFGDCCARHRQRGHPHHRKDARFHHAPERRIPCRRSWDERPAGEFVAAARENNSHIIAISAMLTTTVAGMKKTIRALREAEESDQWHIIVGGAPVNGRFARRAQCGICR